MRPPKTRSIVCLCISGVTLYLRRPKHQSTFARYHGVCGCGRKVDLMFDKAPPEAVAELDAALKANAKKRKKR